MLRTRFTRLAASVGAPPDAVTKAWADLSGRYGEAHRRYHTLDHIGQVLGDCERLAVAGATAADPTAVALAAWYHDAVYDPRASDNEDASARLAEFTLKSWGTGAARRATVTRLILATKRHEPAQPDEALLIDADLAVLAASPVAYGAYGSAIRAEYGWLDEVAWRRGRAAFLDGMLARERLYHTPLDRERRETRARVNLTAERARLAGAP